jgi:hypothetical protein
LADALSKMGRAENSGGDAFGDEVAGLLATLRSGGLACRVPVRMLDGCLRCVPIGSGLDTPATGFRAGGVGVMAVMGGR